ncbi:MAG: hypothetical protein QXY01_05120 [Candidatus Bathyarchaeia archaeon]
MFLAVSLKVFLMIALVTLVVPAARGFDGVMVSTSRPVYYAGEPVVVIFQSSHPADIMGTAKIIVSGPAGTVTAGTMNVMGGVVYSTTISGSFLSIPGYYTVTVIVDIVIETYQGSTSFQVVQRTPFDFTVSISPQSLTVKKGETARFNWAVTYSDPSYQGTRFTWDISGLDPSIQKKVDRGVITLVTSDTTPPGSYLFTFTLSARGVTRSATATLIVEALFDYSLSISPGSQTVNIGEKISYTVAADLIGGAAQPVSLTLSGLPSGVSYVFTPASGTPSFTSTLTVDAGSSSSPGTYTLTVTATGGGLTRTATATLTINEKDFKLSPSPGTITVEQGDSASLQVKVEPVGAFDDPVSLTVSGIPSGVDSKFTVPSGVPPFTTNLNLNIPFSTPEGAYTLTVKGEGGGRSHSISVTLNIEKKPFALSLDVGVEGIKAKVSGTLTPPMPAPGARITLQYHTHPEDEEGEGEVVTREVEVKPDGSFSDEFSPGTLGEWDVRAFLRDEGDNVIAVSEIEYFTIEKSPMNELKLLAARNPLLLALPLIAAVIAAGAITKFRKGKRAKPAPTQGPVYCRNCGEPLGAEDEFCPSCGTRRS